MKLNSPEGFLKVGGVVLVLLALVGYLGIIPENSVFYLTNGENLAHLVLGVVALLLVYLVDNDDIQKWVVVLVGVLALVFVVWGFLVSGNPYQNFYGLANLENPADQVLHLVVGVWALWAAFSK